MIFDIEQFNASKLRKTRRREKISSLLRTYAAKWIQEHIDDSGVVVSVTRVILYEDLSRADIYVLLYPQEKEVDVFKKLKNASKELRYFLAQRIRFKYMPEIVIVKDEQELLTERVEQLLDKIKKG